jgi:eukaryotic-like serine/threonine-protein kinase
MGTVYLGRMIAGSAVQTVAIKVLHPHLASDTDMVAMFLDEARVATRLRHPNLVGVLDMDMLGDELVIVMEYVEGATLGTLQNGLRKRGEKLPLGISVRIMCNALAGLHVVHELLDDEGKPLGLVHRDVSPHNLMVGSDGLTRVTDFGVALTAGRLATTRPDGTVKGKLAYLAPEQVGRKPVDRRVDVFAAGIVLWECLTGERLFEAPTEAEIVTRVLRDPVPPPSMLRPEISTELDEVTLQALERDPDRRFQTAQAFADALREAVAHVPHPATAKDVGAIVYGVASEAIRAQRESLDRAALAPAQPRSDLPPKPKKRWPAVVVLIAALIVGGAAVPWAISAHQTAAPAAAGAPSLPLPARTEAQPQVSAEPPETKPQPARTGQTPEPFAAEPTSASAGRGPTTRGPRAERPAQPPKAPQPTRPKRPFMPDDL